VIDGVVSKTKHSEKIIKNTLRSEYHYPSAYSQNKVHPHRQHHKSVEHSLSGVLALTHNVAEGVCQKQAHRRGDKSYLQGIKIGRQIIAHVFEIV
jgi:hypothetical protein